jgi:hypothetical protein
LITIKLSPGDVAYATTEAVARFNYNRSKGNDATRGAAPTWVEQIAREISGALGEIAIARWQDKFPFSLFNDRKDGDVGEFEVRTTAYSTGKLLVNSDDNPVRKYLLVTLPDHYTANIVGWMYGYEAQIKQFWDTKMRIPCYAVTQEHLRNPESLING